MCVGSEESECPPNETPLIHQNPRRTAPAQTGSDFAVRKSRRKERSDCNFEQCDKLGATGISPARFRQSHVALFLANTYQLGPDIRQE